jgi:hypothetical protein
MKNILLAAALSTNAMATNAPATTAPATTAPATTTLAIGSPAGAQIRLAANQVRLTTCWYNENRELTGSEAAPPGASAGTTTQGEASGNHAWSYTVAGEGAKACPARLPVSSETRS